MRILHNLIPLLPLLRLSLAQLTRCYFTDGSEAARDLPCQNVTTGESTMCCGPAGLCMSNGLCFDPITMTMNRGSCSDKTWSSDSCVKYCTESLYSGLFPCTGDSTFSCKRSDCSSTFEVPEGKVIWNSALQSIYDNSDASKSDKDSAASSSTSTASGSGSSSTASPQTSGTSTSLATAAPAKSSNSNAATIGIGVGLGIPLLIIASALAYFLIRSRKNKRQTENAHTFPAGGPGPTGNQKLDMQQSHSQYDSTTGPPPLPHYSSNNSNPHSNGHAPQPPAMLHSNSSTRYNELPVGQIQR